MTIRNKPQALAYAALSALLAIAPVAALGYLAIAS